MALFKRIQKQPKSKREVVIDPFFEKLKKIGFQVGQSKWVTNNDGTKTCVEIDSMYYLKELGNLTKSVDIRKFMDIKGSNRYSMYEHISTKFGDKEGNGYSVFKYHGAAIENKTLNEEEILTAMNEDYIYLPKEMMERLKPIE